MRLAFLVLISASAIVSQDGATLYQQNCAQCHDGGMDRAPSRAALRAMSADRVLAAMETGPMISMASRRSAQERRILAEFVAGKKLTGVLETKPSPQAMCANSGTALSQGPAWLGWGGNLSNTRFQDSASAGLSTADVPRLKVKWAFGFPGDQSANAHPIVVGGRVYVGSAGGTVYSLSAATGCIYWYFETGSTVRGAIAIHHLSDSYLAFFGDARANMYAVDALSGEQLWKTKVDDFPLAGITSSPQIYQGRLYVGVKSGEEAAGADPNYECCRFRGSLVALDALTGKQVWKTYTIEEPERTKKNAKGVQMWGPSGATIWSTPVIDPRRNAVYVTTGDNYSEPATRTSDAFLALDLDTGKTLWSRQMTADDAYTAACRLPDKTNCPINGPDFDFGASPILVTLPNGKRALLAGQKSGIVHALDPDQQGEVLWQVRVGKGGTMGGVQWGSAVDSQNIYVAVSDIKRLMLTFTTLTDADPNQGGGMYALKLTTGEKVWYTPPFSCGERKRCSPAQSAAVTAIPGAAFSGSVDGHLRAYSTADGKVIWDFDTVREFKTVNGVDARGGSVDGPGPAIVGGMLFANSGYVSAGGMPGNVLLSFTVDGK